jgi:hypothetical protein
MRMRHKVTLGRIIGAIISLTIFVGGIWFCINLRESGVSWFGLSPEWTGRLSAGVFLILFLWVSFKYGDKFVYWWIKVEEENKDGSFSEREKENEVWEYSDNKVKRVIFSIVKFFGIAMEYVSAGGMILGTGVVIYLYGEMFLNYIISLM